MCAYSSCHRLVMLLTRFDDNGSGTDGSWKIESIGWNFHRSTVHDDSVDRSLPHEGAIGGGDILGFAPFDSIEGDKSGVTDEDCRKTTNACRFVLETDGSTRGIGSEERQSAGWEKPRNEQRKELHDDAVQKLRQQICSCQRFFYETKCEKLVLGKKKEKENDKGCHC